MSQKIAALMGAVVLVLCFQNCSGNGVSFDTQTTTAASTAPVADGTGDDGVTPKTPSNSTPVSTPVGTPILGTIAFSDVMKITFTGSLDLYWAGVYNTNSVVTFDHNQHSFDASYAAGGLKYIPTLSCQSQGTLSDYNNLQSALEKMTFSITHSAISFDFVAASMKIYLKNGTVKSYDIDTGVTQISVNNVSHVDAKALKSLMKALLFNAGCSY